MTRNRAPRASRSDGGTELEVGGFGLVLGGIVVGALCVGSFLLGRWSVEVVAPRGTPVDDGVATVEDAGDVEAELTFFDRLEKAPELSAQGDERTVSPPSRPAPGAPPAEGEAARTDGPFQVQVLASAERSAAEAVLARLRLRGYAARMVEGEKDGAPLYRVRVGGYADEEGARQVAQEIERKEGLRTWVTR